PRADGRLAARDMGAPRDLAGGGSCDLLLVRKAPRRAPAGGGLVRCRDRGGLTPETNSRFVLSNLDSRFEPANPLRPSGGFHAPSVRHPGRRRSRVGASSRARPTRGSQLARALPGGCGGFGPTAILRA